MTISFVQILNLLNKLQVLSYFRRKEVVEDFNKEYKKDRIKQSEILREEQSGESPHHGYSPHGLKESSGNEAKARGMFTVTAI